MFAKYTVLPMEYSRDISKFIEDVTALIIQEQTSRYYLIDTLSLHQYPVNYFGATAIIRTVIDNDFKENLTPLLLEGTLDLDNLGSIIYSKLQADLSLESFESCLSLLAPQFYNITSLVDSIVSAAKITNFIDLPTVGKTILPAGIEELLSQILSPIITNYYATFRDRFNTLISLFTNGYTSKIITGVSALLEGETVCSNLPLCYDSYSFIQEDIPAEWQKVGTYFKAINEDGITYKYVTIKETPLSSIDLLLHGELSLGVVDNPVFNKFSLKLPPLTKPFTIVISATKYHLAIQIFNLDGDPISEACLIGEISRWDGIGEGYPSTFQAKVSELFTHTGITAKTSPFNPLAPQSPYGDNINIGRLIFNVGWPVTEPRNLLAGRIKNKTVMMGSLNPTMNTQVNEVKVHTDRYTHLPAYHWVSSEVTPAYYFKFKHDTVKNYLWSLLDSSTTLQLIPIGGTTSEVKVGTELPPKYPYKDPLLVTDSTNTTTEINRDFYSREYFKVSDVINATNSYTHIYRKAVITVDYYDPPVYPAFSVQLPKLKSSGRDIVGKYAGLYTHYSLGLRGESPAISYKYRGLFNLNTILRDTNAIPKAIKVFNPGIERVRKFTFQDEQPYADFKLAADSFNGWHYEQGEIIQGGTILGPLTYLEGVPCLGGSTVLYGEEDYYALRSPNTPVEDKQGVLLVAMEGGSLVDLIPLPLPTLPPTPDPTPAPINPESIVRTFQRHVPVNDADYWTYEQSVVAWVNSFMIQDPIYGNHLANPYNGVEFNMIRGQLRSTVFIDVIYLSSYFYGIGASIKLRAFYEAKYFKLLLGTWDMDPIKYLASIPVFYRDLYTFLQLAMSGVTHPKLENWTTWSNFCQVYLPKLTRANRVESYLTYKWGSFVNILTPESYKFLIDDDEAIEAVSSMINKQTHFCQRYTFESINAATDSGFAISDYYNNYRMIDLEPNILNFVPESDSPMSFMGGQFRVSNIDYSLSTWMPTITIVVWSLEKPTTPDPSLTTPYVIPGELKHKVSLVAIHEAAHTIDTSQGRNTHTDFGFSLMPEWLAIGGWVISFAQNSDGMHRIDPTTLKYPSEVTVNDVEPPPTPYGCSHPWEDFAESWVAYQFNPLAFQQWYPKRYAFMRDRVIPYLESRDKSVLKANY